MSRIDGATIRKRRMQNGISLRKLSQMVDISPGYLSLLENGKRTTSNQYLLDRIIDILDKQDEIKEQYIREEMEALEAGRNKAGIELEIKLRDLNDLLRAYNNAGDMTFDETWDILERVRYIVREAKGGDK